MTIQPGPAATYRSPGIRTIGTGRSWLHTRDLLRELIRRDMHLRYRGSALGMAWTLLNPITELLVLMFIFTVVLPINIPNFPAFLFTGLLAYGWFSSALIFATGAIVNNRELVKRPGVPVGVLPVVPVASTFLHFLFSLPVLFVLLLATGVEITRAVLVLPALIGVQFVLILTLAYPLATVNVWFRDTQHFLRVALQLLFYLTPIFYEVRMIPERFRPVYGLNPLVHVIDGYRAVLVWGVFPNTVPLLVVTAVSGGLLIMGVALFRRASYRFADEL